MTDGKHRKPQLVHAHHPVYETLCGTPEPCTSGTTEANRVTCPDCIEDIACGAFTYS